MEKSDYGFGRVKAREETKIQAFDRGALVMRGVIVSLGVYMCVLLMHPIYQLTVYPIFQATGDLVATFGDPGNTMGILEAIFRWSPLAIMALCLAWVIATAFSVEGVSWRSSRRRGYRR